MMTSFPAMLCFWLAAIQAAHPPTAQTDPLRGIKQLAIVVDKMDAADAGCGLTENALQTAAAKGLADNSLGVAASRQDFQPFLYIRTTTLRTREGECITHVLESVRAYVTPPKLVWMSEEPVVSLEVVLKEQVGLIYSPEVPPHAESVASAIGRYAGRIAAAVAAANK